MVLPDLMETEDNLIDYVKLRNIEGKISIKKTRNEDDLEEESGKSVDENPIHIENSIDDENPIPIESSIDDEKLEISNLDVTTSPEQELPVENENESNKKTSESDKESESKRKGILKYKRTYSNKHVDFNMDLEFVPFDESKDYTIEIKIVEQMPKKIVSYAALFAQQKKEEEEKLKKEAEEKERQKRIHNKKRKYHEWKKNRKPDKSNNKPIGNKIPILETEHNSSCLEGNDLVENHMDIEDQINDEKEDLSDNVSHSDTDVEFSDSVSIESESIMYEDENSFTDPSQGTDFESSNDDLNVPLNDTETAAEIEQTCHSEPTENKSESCKVQGIAENIETSAITNSADNLHLFCIPTKKQRSNSLSDLDDFRKSHRFVVQRLPREIELIISRQLEKQHYE